MDTAVGTRHVACDGAFNIRDLVGIPRRTGRRPGGGRSTERTVSIASGRPPPASCEVWDGRPLLDLRTSGEVELGTFRSEGAEVVHLPVLQEI